MYLFRNIRVLQSIQQYAIFAMMLLLSSHIVQFVFIFKMLSTIDPVEPVFPSLAKSTTRRTQSMNTFSRNIELNQIIDSQAASTSGTSSSSRSSPVKAKSNTPTSIANEGDSFKEIEVRPLIEEMDRESLHRLSVAQLGASEASLATNGPINPARDGVRARVRKFLQRHGVPVAVGSVVGAGVGGFYVGTNWINNNNTSSNLSTTTTTSTTKKVRVIDKEDDITNPM